MTISEGMWSAFGFSFASDWLKKRCKSLWSIMEYLRAVLSWIAFELPINPLTPMSDQGRISPYNINTISTRWVMRIKKNITLLGPILNSLNYNIFGSIWLTLRRMANLIGELKGLGCCGHYKKNYCIWSVAITNVFNSIWQ